jgi:Leucine-rich repeat (LRR) protein
MNPRPDTPSRVRPPSSGGAAPVDRRIGSLLGNFQIVGILGEGGMGVVYEAVDRFIERRVALKVLPDGLAKDPKALKRFLAEAKSAGKLNHPNAVAIHQVGEQAGTYFIVMELVRGGSARDFINGRGPFNWPEATRITADVCRALYAAHQVGLVHRDIKPSNIMRASDGTVKLADFGLAKQADGGGVLSAAGVAVGTPEYMSPEQCYGRPLDGRTDIYSLGATFFTLLTGRSPYGGRPGVVETMQAHCSDPIPDPRMFNPSVPDAVAEIVFRAMAKKPADRHQTIAEMLAELEAVLPAEGAPVGPGPEWSDFVAALPGRRSTTIRPVSGSLVTTAAPAARDGRSLLTGMIAGAVLAAGVTVLGAALLLRGTGEPVPAKTDPPAAVVPPVRPADPVTLDPEPKVRLPEPPPDPPAKTEPPEIRRDPEPKRDPDPPERPPDDPVVAEFVRKIAAVQLLGPEDRADAGKVLADLAELAARHIGSEDRRRRETAGVAREMTRRVRLRLKLNRPGPADPAFVERVSKMPVPRQIEAVTDEIRKRNPGFSGGLLPTMEGGVVTGVRLAPEQVWDLTPLRAFSGLQNLFCAGSESKTVLLEDISPLKGLALRVIDVSGTGVSDLSALEGAPLEVANLSGCRVTDLSPLRKASLRILYLRSTPVADLSPLAGQPLSELNIAETQVADLSPLRGGLVSHLTIDATPVSDLSPLKGMESLTILSAYKTPVRDLSPLARGKLRELKLSFSLVSDLTPLRGLPLQRLLVRGTTVADVSALADSLSLEALHWDMKAWHDPAGIALLRTLPRLRFINDSGRERVLAKAEEASAAWRRFLADVAGKRPDEQVAAVVAKLKETNPGFDGEVRPQTGSDAVTGLALATDSVWDLSPLRALPELENLFATGRGPGRGRLWDLSPLVGLKLRNVSLVHNHVRDLSALADMPLERLDVSGNPVTDLRPLARMRLRSLGAMSTEITDLSPLRQMKLEELDVGGTRVRDLSPLAGMPLLTLRVQDTPAKDLAVLRGMPLKDLRLSFDPARDQTLLKSLPELRKINGLPAEEFWSRNAKP